MYIQKLFNILTSENEYRINNILYLFEDSDIENLIEMVIENKSNELFVSNLSYYCYIFRSQKIIQDLTNHDQFPNDIFLSIIYYNYGRWILADLDADEYFEKMMVNITPIKSMNILLQTDIVKMDLNLTLYLLGNLDSKMIDSYFAKIKNLNEILDIFIDIFQNLGEEGLRHFFTKNPYLYGYLIVLMQSYKDRKSIREFLSKNEKNINLIDKLVHLSNNIKHHFNYEKEKHLPPNERNPSRLLYIIHEIEEYSNIYEVINILSGQGIFIDESEKEIIYKLLSDPYLKQTIISHLTMFAKRNHNSIT